MILIYNSFIISYNKHIFILDINECLTNNGGCGVNAKCINTIGSRICECNPGFSGDGLICRGEILIIYCSKFVKSADKNQRAVFPKASLSTFLSLSLSNKDLLPS